VTKQYDEIDGRLKKFLSKQHVFFVATAPSGLDGHVNLSPKGLDSFFVLGPRRVGYVDLIGSGVETIAHLRENGRIVLLFCAFEGSPKIVRLHGRGRVLEPHDTEFREHEQLLPKDLQPRSLVIVDLDRISDSCGYGVPLYEFQGKRKQLSDWAAKKGPAGLIDYQKEKNAESIDGLPGLRWTTPRDSLKPGA
jgi:hypothetical protein